MMDIFTCGIRSITFNEKSYLDLWHGQLHPKLVILHLQNLCVLMSTLLNLVKYMSLAAASLKIKYLIIHQHVLNVTGYKEINTTVNWMALPTLMYGMTRSYILTSSYKTGVLTWYLWKTKKQNLDNFKLTLKIGKQHIKILNTNIWGLHFWKNIVELLCMTNIWRYYIPLIMNIFHLNNEDGTWIVIHDESDGMVNDNIVLSIR